MKGFVQKRTTRIVGIATILVLALIIGAVTAVATTKASTAQASSPLRVAVYCDAGANPANTAATLRAVQACGFDFYGIGIEDVKQGRLTTTNYDVLLIPTGASDDKIWYYDTTYGFTAVEKVAVRAFAAAGGGVVGIEGGGNFMCSSSSDPSHCLELYGGTYTPDYVNSGKNTITYTDASFGSGTQELYRTYGCGHIADATASGAFGASTEVATSAVNGSVIQRAEYGTGDTKGRVVVCALDPEVRGDSLLDWTVWDNQVMGGTQSNSIGGWSLIGRMINWAGTGTATAPTVTEHANPAGAKVAILASVDFSGTGGVYPANLPSVFRAVEASGNIPLAIRAADINGVLNSSLTTANFAALIIPDAWCITPNTGLAKNLGEAGATAIKAFANSGGGVMGIGEGSTGYLSADYWTFTAASDWNYYNFTYPATLFQGSVTYYQDSFDSLAGVSTVSDPVVGDVNGGAPVMTYNYDWPDFTGLDFDGGPEAYGANTVAVYSDYLDASDIRCTYGDGHVFLSGPNHELLNGSNDDWTTWDNYYWGGSTPWVNADNPKEWDLFTAALNKWVIQAPAVVVPEITATPAPAANLLGWNTSAVTVDLTAVDHSGTGIKKIQYRMSSPSTPTWIDCKNGATTGQFVVSTEGNTAWRYRALDNAGNVSATGTITVSIDSNKPTVSDNAPTGWNKSAVTVKLSAADSLSGVAKTQYRLGTSGAWIDATANKFVVNAPLDNSNDGAHVYQYQAIDKAGNVSLTGACTVNIDTIAPAVPSDNAPTGWSSIDVVVTLTPGAVGDITQYRLSGPATPTWINTIGNQFTVTANPDHSNDGVHIYRYRSVDAAGNISASGICTVRINTL